jgi:hypothetical protein
MQVFKRLTIHMLFEKKKIFSCVHVPVVCVYVRNVNLIDISVYGRRRRPNLTTSDDSSLKKLFLLKAWV